MRARRRTVNAPSGRVRRPVPDSWPQQAGSARLTWRVGLVRCWHILRAVLHWLSGALVLWGRTLACVPTRDLESVAGPDPSSPESWLRDETTRGLAEIQRYLAQRDRRR
jgi:hypothetical protein